MVRLQTLTKCLGLNYREVNTMIWLVYLLVALAIIAVIPTMVILLGVIALVVLIMLGVSKALEIYLSHDKDE